MSIQIQNALGILSSDVPTGNLLWVDQVNGVDKLARRGRMTIPFCTLIAAKNAASEGDTIVVLPGSYEGLALARAGVNWHFMGGATVTSDSEEHAIFNITGSTSFRVTGAGRFVAPYILIINSADQVYFECEQMESGHSSIIMYSGSDVVVNVKNGIVGDFTPAIDISGGNLALRTRYISGDSTHGIVLSGGAARIAADRIYSSGGNAIDFMGGTHELTATDVVSASDYALECDASSGICRVHNARLLGSSFDNKEAVHITSGSGRVGLQNCALIAGGTADSCIEAEEEDTIVYSYSHIVGNQAIGDNVLLLPGPFSRNEDLP